MEIQRSKSDFSDFTWIEWLKGVLTSISMQYPNINQP